MKFKDSRKPEVRYILRKGSLVKYQENAIKRKTFLSPVTNKMLI